MPYSGPCFTSTLNCLLLDEDIAHLVLYLVQEWAGRISNRTIVHTGGGTNIAMYTHHITTRPRFPPGSISQGTYTLSQ